MGLLKRLTTGMAKREDEAVEQQPAAPAAPAAAQDGRRVETVEPVAVQQRPAPSYGAHSGATDAHGRAVQPAARPSHDDELEIPAFLRRSAG